MERVGSRVGVGRGVEDFGGEGGGEVVLEHFEELEVVGCGILVGGGGGGGVEGDGPCVVFAERGVIAVGRGWNGGSEGWFL